MDPHVVELGPRTDAPPGVLKVGQMAPRLPAGDHPRVVLVVGQALQQPHRRRRQWHRAPASLGVGDFSDVVVIDANGQRIPWPEVAHIEPDEMRDLMREVVNGLYTCHLKAGDPDFFGMLDWAVREAWKWDEPELDEVLLKGLEARRRREQE